MKITYRSDPIIPGTSYELPLLGSILLFTVPIFPFMIDYGSKGRKVTSEHVRERNS